MCLDYLKQYGFISDSNKTVCSECRFEAKETLSISHIQFMHKLSNPKCSLISYLDHNYSLYSALLQKKNAKKNILEIEKIMTKTYNKSVSDGWPKWSKRLPKIEQLVKAGFFYTGEEDEVKCIECGVTLCD